MEATAECNSPYVYETLDAFFPSTSETPPQSYSVFRSEIISSLPPSTTTAAPDYFALDTDEALPVRREESSPPSVPRKNAGNCASESVWFCSGSRFKSPMLQLHKEILDFCEFVSPTPEERASRSAAVDRVFEVIKYIWPHCDVEVFGSFKTGLYLPTSDIDVVILDSKVRTPQMGLQALARALSQRSLAKKIQVIAKARVPIIKFVEKQSGVAFDISFDVENGPKAAEFIKDAVCKIPPLKPLCMILKVFLHQRELNEVFSGGIGSYALLTMLIAQLRIFNISCMHKSRKGQGLAGRQSSIDHNLGVLLVDFFGLYGCKLNICDVGVSCNDSGAFFLKSNKGFLNNERPYLLSIQDPQTPDNDIGKNSFNIFKVRSAFAMAYATLTDAKAILGLGPNKSILGTIIRPDPILLERKGGSNGELTFANLLPGAEQSTLFPLEDEGGDTLYNWRLVDDEPFPRGEVVDQPIPPSRKKRASGVKNASYESDCLKTPDTACKENGAKTGGEKKKRRKGGRDGGKLSDSGSSRHGNSGTRTSG